MNGMGDGGDPAARAPGGKDPKPEPRFRTRESAAPRGASIAPVKQDKWARTQANIRTIGGAVLLAIVIRIGLFEAFEIEGPSMEPTLLNGDRVVVAKFRYGLFLPFMDQAVVSWGTPVVGSVVIVKSPEDGIDIVKRVVGLPGDTIEIRDGQLFRNGEPMRHDELGPCRDADDRRRPQLDGCEWVEESVGEHVYRTSHAIGSLGASHPPIEVPEGHVFVLGDHRDRSNDSRFFGPVPISCVKGQALVIYWSNDDGVRWHRLGHPID